MDNDQLQYFVDRLQRERKRIAQGMDGLEESLDIALEDSIGELSTYDNHPADVGSESFERSKDFALRGDAREIIGAIDDALDRIEQGRYGYCDRCGAEIPVERLKALPYTTRCMACSAAEEIRDHAGSRRPVEEEAFPHPYEFAHDRTSIAYDREDTWQDLAQHGLSTEIEEVEDENRGIVEDIDGIPYEEIDGVFYQSTKVPGDNTGDKTE